MSEEEVRQDDKKLEALEAKLAALTAQVEAAEGKASGILADKKKAQKQAEELQAKLDELEGKGLGEAEKLKLENERMKARLEKAEQEKAELETTYSSEKRSSEERKIASKLKPLDSVPQDAWETLIKNELADLADLGNEVLVNDRIKSISTKYSGLLVAETPSGAGAKATGNNSGTQSGGIEKVLAMSDAEILANPAAALQAAMS